MAEINMIMENLDIFPEEAEKVRREKEKRRQLPYNKDEEIRKSKKRFGLKVARHSRETVDRFVDNAEKKYNRK